MSGLLGLCEAGGENVENADNGDFPSGSCES